MATVGDLADVLERLWPPAWAEAWDNVGLLIGGRDDPVRRCLCALDADVVSVTAAADAGAALLISHHPLPFRPLRRIVAEDPTGRAILLAARRGVAIYAVHTNYDAHPDGIGRSLAGALGVRDPMPLHITARETLYKLVVFTPAGHEDAVLHALASAGAGHLGHYSHCSFGAPGTGTFLPLPGARPYVGHVGAVQRQSEVRLEVLVPESRRAAAVDAMRRAHPYEEVAYDLLRLENDGPPRGFGMLGELPRRTRLSAFAGTVARRLASPTTRFVGDPDRLVRRVAVCGGAGAEFAGAALEAGADVFVTADVRYHEAREAEARGLALIDPGHQATEAPAVPAMVAVVQSALQEAAYAVDVLQEPARADVWRRARMSVCGAGSTGPNSGAG